MDLNANLTDLYEQLTLLIFISPPRGTIKCDLADVGSLTGNITFVNLENCVE